MNKVDRRCTCENLQILQEAIELGLIDCNITVEIKIKKSTKYLLSLDAAVWYIRGLFDSINFTNEDTTYKSKKDPFDGDDDI